MIIEERSSLERMITDLRSENRDLRSERDNLERRINSLQQELERTNQTKEVVNLCKLMLAGSVVPIVSVLIILTLLDGSVFLSS
jgi:hypothetical protein